MACDFQIVCDPLAGGATYHLYEYHGKYSWFRRIPEPPRNYRDSGMRRGDSGMRRGDRNPTQRTRSGR